MGASGTWTIDTGRFGIELLPPDVYLVSSYYERWLLRLERLLVQHGLIDADEIKAGHALRPGATLTRGPFTVGDIDRVLRRRSFGPASTHGTAVQDCRPRAGEEHPSKKPYAPTALRARPCGRIGACAWTPRVSGRDGHGPRRGPTMALYGALRQPRTLGSGCRPNGEGVHRGLRALSAGYFT